jgi:hypothetical protein
MPYGFSAAEPASGFFPAVGSAVATGVATGAATGAGVWAMADVETPATETNVKPMANAQVRANTLNLVCTIISFLEKLLTAV